MLKSSLAVDMYKENNEVRFPAKGPLIGKEMM